MQFDIQSGSPEQQRSGCVIVGVFESRQLSPAAAALDRAAHGFLSAMLEQGELDGALGSTLMLHAVPQLACQRVLLVGLGPEQQFQARQYRQAVAAAVKAWAASPAQDALCTLTELALADYSPQWLVEQAVISAQHELYRFTRFKSQPGKALPQRLSFAVASEALLPECEQALAHGLAIASGIKLTRDLANLPANVCTPSYLAEQARELAGPQLEAEILEQPQLEALGMHSFLAVARGSVQPPKLIVLKYWGAAEREAAPLVLVGKGITFDSGGISLKPGDGMDEMKFDMCGAASVLGAVHAAAQLKLPLNLIAIVPSCENMPAGNAVKPGDIVRSLSGQSIEILNTDAEGRLILCDALTYAERFKPAAVVDVATLTGACVVALGHVYSGLYSNRDALAAELKQAGEASGDRAWHMPLDQDYMEQLDSPFADVSNLGGRPAGSVTAAMFLARFAEAYPWAHLDIAGSASKSGKERAATGRPVALLVEFLRQRAAMA